jgi:hypothetical protein
MMPRFLDKTQLGTWARIAVLGGCVGGGFALAASDSPIRQLSGLGLVFLPIVALVLSAAVRQSRVARAFADASAMENPAFEALPRIDVLLDPETRLDHLRGKVSCVRTYSNPEWRGSARTGGMLGVFRTAVFDIHGEVHEVDEATAFGELERKARALAERLEVPFESHI